MITQEEADTILSYQVSVLGPGKTVVICNDTDVFVLHLHFVSTGDSKAHVLMQSTSLESINVIDINATFEKHVAIVPNILAAHALSGCDTVGIYFAIGKATVIKVLNTKNSFCAVMDSRQWKPFVMPGNEYGKQCSQKQQRCTKIGITSTNRPSLSRKFEKSSPSGSNMAQFVGGKSTGS